MSATQQAYLDRYKRVAQREGFYGGMPSPETAEGKPNYTGFWYPLMAVVFIAGMYMKGYMSAKDTPMAL